jgi:signal transduction histidine kinase
VYLLDTTGRILAQALPPDSVFMDRVDIQPVKALIAGNVDMPYRGDDPRNPNVRKVFSAAEVRAGDQLQGYLYVILGGQKYDQLVSTLRGSYVRNIGLWAVIALVAFGAAIGLLVFAMLTRRLRQLTTTVQQFSEQHFETVEGASAETRDSDEIDHLQSIFGRMAVRIREQVERLTETDRLRRELVTNISHDLRTPLASMQGYLETLLIRNGSLTHDERERCLRIARKNTERLRELIDDLFEFSKLDSASVTPSFETFSMAELLQDTSLEFELEAAEKGITIHTEAPADSAVVYADISLIQRVLENLLRNAIKFTPRNGHIRIGIEQRPRSVAVSVSDTGCGIAEAEIGRIFDRFYRREPDRRGESGSAGLGLAIVKRILDLHGSRITVTSEINRGTRFEFDLPCSLKAA